LIDKTILIIDDMKHIRDMLWLEFKQEGYLPITAETGQKGLHYLFAKENRVDLVILDIMMPKMNGFQVLEKIRTSNDSVSQTPVIMLTGNHDKNNVIKGLSKGANEYILKPYKFLDVLARVRKYIG
jgi:DNA-binding response OmpR family regulator